MRVGDPESEVIAYVRFDLDDDGRLAPAQLIASAFHRDDAGRLRVRRLRGADLRTFPLAAAEAAVNGELRDQVLADIGRKMRASLELEDGTTTPLDRPPRTKRKPDSSTEFAVAPITVPSTRPFPDDFYAEVAAVYTRAAARSRRPASDIAEASDVNVSAVHRWIAEARKRGYLPPGRPGMVG